MKINNQNNISFQGNFLIRTFPVGEKVTASGRIGSMYEYATQALSKKENSLNKTMNKRIVKFIKETINKYGETHKVEIKAQMDMDWMLKEYFLKIDDKMDDFISSTLNSLNEKKYFWQSSNLPKVDFHKFGNLKPHSR